MTFFNNKVVAIERLNDGIYLVRKVKDEIYMDYVKEDTNIFHKEVVINDSLGEFDIDLDLEGNIDILYINAKHDLILYKLVNNEDVIKVIYEDLKNRIVELTLVNIGDIHNIFFMIETENRQVYKIYHIYIENDEQFEFLVDEIETYQILNPLRIIKDDTNIILAYYFKNQICIKMFNTTKRSWSHSITLTNNQNKLYLDISKFEDRIHLVYAEYSNEVFTIKYERFLIDNDYILKEKEMNLSNSGNNTDPILIYVGRKIWVVWKETNQLLSTYSADNGETWSDIYLWKDSKKLDIVKYKYLTNLQDQSFKIDYSYGSVNKDIRFIGFGNLDNTEILKMK